MQPTEIDFENPHGIVLDFDIIIRKFNIQLCYYIYFWMNTVEKGIKSP